MGSPLFPWQRFVVDVALEVDDNGDWVYDEVVVTVPRQSGKSFLIGPVTAHRCSQGWPASVWMTAQKGKSKDRWLAVVEAMLATPLRRQVKFTHGVGNELVQWRSSGSTFRPFPATATAMHGESPDLVFVDELWTFSALQQQNIEEGYEPAWSVKQGQAWLLSTAGHPKSEWLNLVRRNGRAAVEDDVREGTAYFEWSAPDTVDGRPLATLDDDELLRVVIDAHPRRDHGLREAKLRRDLTKRPRPRWLRDYANITQSDEDTLGVFDQRALDRARSSAAIPDDGRLGLGVAVDPDRRDAAIGIAWRDTSGVAVTDDRRADGTRWVAGSVIELVDRYDVGVVAVVAAGPARSVADELDRAGVPLLRLSQADWAAACAGFGDEFTTSRPSVTWNGGVDFARAVADAESVRRASGRVWQSRSGSSVSSLDARTLAVWGHDHAPVPVRRLDPEIW